MAEIRVASVADVPAGQKKVVKAGETEILLIHHDGGFAAVQSKCPHAGAPLEKGSVCNGRLVCPWHMGTFAIDSGVLLEPPAVEPLATYAVRVRGEDIFVDPEPQPPAHQRAQQSSETPVFLLVGTGAAGAMAATTLRDHGFAGKIVAVDPVAAEPVDRTQLTKKALSGKTPLDKVGLGTFAAVDVQRLHAAVTEISAARSEARLSDGTTIRFHRALVATGGTPKRLQIPGSELAHTIRHPEDVGKILAVAESARQVVVIGTSFIALEAASALVQKGLPVTVVGKDNLPFAGKFGAEVSCAVQALHESKGTNFRLGVEIVAISASGVTVRQGGRQELIAADLVIEGVGVQPELGFAHDLPLAPNGGGIAADESLCALEHVWVAGDIANVNGTRIEHWRLAQQHGQIAALSMLGRDAKYDGVPFFWTFHFGKRLGYLGHANEWDEIVTEGDIRAFAFVNLYVKDAVVKAVLTCGQDSKTALLAEVMRTQPTLAQVRLALA